MVLVHVAPDMIAASQEHATGVRIGVQHHIRETTLTQPLSLLSCTVVYLHHVTPAAQETSANHVLNNRQRTATL
jgi:hypothetical protein